MGRPSARERQPYDIDKITDIAVAVFNQRGYEAASLEHIARAARIAKSSIYYHVSGKEELLARGTGRALNALFKVLDEPGANEGRALERVKHVLRRTIEITVEQLPEVALLLRVRGNTATERRVLERRRQFDRRVAEMVRRAAEKGDLRSDIDPRLVTRLLFGMSNSITEWYRPSGELNAGGIAAAILRLAFNGLQ